MTEGFQSKMAEDFIPLTYDKVNSFLRRKAEIELEEDELRTRYELQQLKKLIDQKEVPTKTDDAFLMWFLRSKKHDVKRAFDQLQKYSFQRHNLMSYYGFIDFHKILIPIEQGICGVLPRRDAEGRVVMFLRACVWRSSVCSADDVLRALQALIHFCLEYPATQIAGFSFIFDNYLASLDTLHLFLKYATVLAPTITAFPGRFQKIAIVNTNIVLRSITPILLSVMPGKLRKRTCFYGDAKTALPEIFDPSILPEEFGGTYGPMTSLHHSWINLLQDFVPKLRATNRYFKRKNTVFFPEEENDEDARTAI